MTIKISKEKEDAILDSLGKPKAIVNDAIQLQITFSCGCIITQDKKGSWLNRGKQCKTFPHEPKH